MIAPLGPFNAEVKGGKPVMVIALWSHDESEESFMCVGEDGKPEWIRVSGVVFPKGSNANPGR